MQIELAGNKHHHNVTIFADNDFSAPYQKHVKTNYERLANVLLDYWLGLHKRIENDCGIFICDSKGNLIDFQSCHTKTVDELSSCTEWPTSRMLDEAKQYRGSPDIIINNLQIPHGVYSIGLMPDIYRSLSLSKSFCFRNIIVFGELLFPHSLRIIGSGAFSHSMIWSMNLPSSVFVIGNYTFYGCTIQNLYLEKDFAIPPEDFSNIEQHSRYVDSLNLWLVGRQFYCNV